MKHPEKLRASIPFTSANLGPGFDIFGLALNVRCELEFTFTESRKDPDTMVFDSSGKLIYKNESNNLIRDSYLKTFASFHHWISMEPVKDVPGFNVSVKMPIPPGRGFGSSAVACLAGNAAALHVLKSNGMSGITLDEEMIFLTNLEGHADNICAARVGGWNLFHTNAFGQIIAIKKKVPSSLGLILFYPDFSISTNESRAVLPSTYNVPDVLSNLGGIGLWMEFLDSGNFNFLSEALKSDRLHEPHRIPTIRGFAEIKELLLSAGATGVALSGSGPGILGFFDKKARENLLSAVRSAQTVTAGWIFQECDVDPNGLILS